MPGRAAGYRMTMAHVCRHFDAAPEDVFAVIAEPRTYPDWLIGAWKIRSVDDNWPSPGSSFHHVVGVPPLVLADSTTVMDVEPGRSLVLHVKARPFVSGRVTFRITGDGDDGCILSIEEEPKVRTIGNLVRPILDPMTHVRNQRSLERMEPLVVERRQERIRAEAANASR
jgi:uncharacterized protein YndB with AHSA1/START domain